MRNTSTWVLHIEIGYTLTFSVFLFFSFIILNEFFFLFKIVTFFSFWIKILTATYVKGIKIIQREIKQNSNLWEIFCIIQCDTNLKI